MRIALKSLRLKIITYVFISSVLIITLLGMLVYVQIRDFTDTLARENLLEQARRIASYIEYDWRGRLDLDFPQRWRDYYGERSSDHQYAVTNSGGKPFFRSDNFMADRIGPVMDKAGKTYFDFVTPEGKVFAGLRYDYMFEGRVYSIFIIENKKIFSLFLETLEYDFFSKILLYGGALLLLQGLFIVLILRTSLRPVLRVSRDAGNIEYSNLSFRLDETHVPTEILPLIRSVNKSLSRLERGAEAQQMFIANAAHELRTPISILKARISSLKNEKEIYMLNEDLRSINRLISQILDISRLDLVESPPMKEVTLNDMAKRVCEDMGALFVSRGKDLSLEEKEKNQTINGNEDMLFRALLNLLENALKHSPEKTPVQVIVDKGKIIVRDHGAPIPEEDRERIFERFEKRPESLQTKGSGLGLSIVRKAAEIHGGRIYVEPRRDGNDFVLDFT